MFKFFLNIVMLTCFCCPATAQQPIEVVVLETVSYKDVFDLAKQNNKNVYILFTGKNCHWCDKQKKVFDNLEVSNILKDYVVCFVDIDLEKQVSKKFKIKSVPTHFILNKDETILNKNNGFMNEVEFKKWLENPQKVKRVIFLNNRLKIKL